MEKGFQNLCQRNGEDGRRLVVGPRKLIVILRVKIIARLAPGYCEIFKK
jgi:hypothetical protein